MAQTLKKRITGKRDFTEISNIDDVNEPRRKRQRFENKFETQDGKKWTCKQCTLENEAKDKKCIVCNIPKDYKFKNNDNDHNNHNNDDQDDNDNNNDNDNESDKNDQDEYEEYIDNENDALFETSDNQQNKNKLKKSDTGESWGDDEDIDLNYDGQEILSLNNKDIASRTQIIDNKLKDTSNNSNNSSSINILSNKKKEKTINGLEYTECWICTSCFAMNRLLDTLSIHQLKCGFCNGSTYNPTKTDIIKSFEWDQQQQPQQRQPLPRRGHSSSSSLSHHNGTSQAAMFAQYERKKKRKYMTKNANSREGDVLITGMINQENVIKLSTIGLVPQDVVRLCLLFHGDFDHDGFDTQTNRDDFELNKGLTVATRTLKDSGQWRNVFSMRECKLNNDNDDDNDNDNDNDNAIKFEWKLKCNKRINKDWEDEPVESIIIGVIESKGIKSNMGTAFTAYPDGWGLLGDGQKVNDGNYEKFNGGFHHGAEIHIILQFIKHEWNGSKQCHLIFNNKLAYRLNAEKVYKLAIAMNSREYEIEWIAFDKSHTPIDI